MTPRIGLPDETRSRVIDVLQGLLADEIALYLKTRNFHWNVEGPHFITLHQLFESQYEALDVAMDEVAERIRALGGYASGSMHEFVQRTHLPEITGGPRGDERMELLLLRDHEAVIQRMRATVDALEDLGDAGTQDFVTGLMERHEKTAWRLRALVAAPA
jgi:starvation-inducible DNA-binding protein